MQQRCLASDDLCMLHCCCRQVFVALWTFFVSETNKGGKTNTFSDVSESKRLPDEQHSPESLSLQCWDPSNLCTAPAFFLESELMVLIDRSELCWFLFQNNQLCFLETVRWLWVSAAAAAASLQSDSAHLIQLQLITANNQLISWMFLLLVLDFTIFASGRMRSCYPIRALSQHSWSSSCGE